MEYSSASWIEQPRDGGVLSWSGLMQNIRRSKLEPLFDFERQTPYSKHLFMYINPRYPL